LESKSGRNAPPFPFFPRLTCWMEKRFLIAFSPPAPALGFCFLNNAAIAARYWQLRHGRRRAFIIEWDAHHGNGIQEVFEQDPEVCYASIHEHPTFSFPCTGYAEDKGSGPGSGATLNIPLAQGGPR